MNPHDEDDLNQVDESQFDDLNDPSFDQDALDDVGGDFGSEGEPWGDDDNSFDDGTGADEPAPKKKSSLISYLLIGAVVLGAGAFGYVKFFANKAPSVVATDSNGEPLPPSDRSSLTALRDQPGDQYMPTPADTPPPQATGPKSQGGFMNAPAEEEPPAPAPDVSQTEEPASLPVPGSAVAPTPAPTPGLPQGGPSLTAVETPDAPPTDALPPAGKPDQPADPGVALLPGIKPTSDFPSVDLIKKAAPTAVEPPVTPDKNAPVVPEVAPETVAEKPADTLPPVEPPTSAVPELPAGLATAPTLSAEPKPAPAENAAATTEMQEKLSAAESRIADLEKQLEEAKANAVNDNARPFERAAAAEPVKVARPARPQAAPETTKAPVKRVVADDAPKPILKSNWELRSAQPGQAMVSTKNGKGDIRTVFVGDTLAGVGRITAITRTPSGWVVRGTTGTLHQ